MNLEDLEELFGNLDWDGPNEEQLKQLYEIYLTEVCNMKFKGQKIMVNKNKSRHPICKGRDQTFEHIITRESKHSQKRNFDPQRANRIHWIKPIVENSDRNEIKYFEELNGKNQLQYFFWYEEKNFIVLIREIFKGRVLITAYYVDEYRKIGFKKKYENYKKA